MVDNNYLCIKCNRSISFKNKTLHDAQCKEAIQYNSNQDNDIKFCNICDNYLSTNFYDDHMFSHEIGENNSMEGIDSNNSLEDDSGIIII